MRLVVYRIIVCIIILIIVSENISSQERSLSENLTLHELEYINGTLWAVDYGKGNVLKSTDDGDNWRIEATLGSEYFEQIQFVNESTGFVCGDYGYVYRTNDGGKSWEEISPKIKDRITERYRNDSTKNQKPEGQFIAYYEMSFRNSENGYVTGFKMSPKVGGSSYQPLAFITQDGGSTWDETTNNDLKKQEYIPADLQEGVYLGVVFSLGEQLKWRMKKVEGEFVVQKSSDGGDAWVASTLPGYNGEDKWMLRKILFLDKLNGFVFGGTLDDGLNKALVFITKDGGKTWQPYPKEWPHLHDAIIANDKIYISGKQGFFRVVVTSEFDQ